MLTSGVLDVVIGLAFIYLLYSLLATTVQEGWASIGQRRAVMLRQGIRQMLTNTDYKFSTVAAYYVDGFYNSIVWLWTLPRRTCWLLIYARRTWYSNRGKTLAPPFSKGIPGTTYTAIRSFLLKMFPQKPAPVLEFWQQFYEHPLIKNYGENRRAPLPSYIPATSFSAVTLDLLERYAGGNTAVHFETYLSGTPRSTLPLDTEKILSLLLTEAKRTATKKINTAPLLPGAVANVPTSNDILTEFKLELEHWFNDSMVRVTGWYKRKTQLSLFTIGLVLAFGFNVDSIEIANKLSKDKEARKQIADMAAAYINNNKAPAPGTATPPAEDKKTDSLVGYAQTLLKKDIENANALLAIGYNGYGEKDDSFVQRVLMANPDYKRLILKEQVAAQEEMQNEVKYLRLYSDSIRSLGDLFANRGKVPPPPSNRVSVLRTALLDRQKALSDSIVVFDSVAIIPLAKSENEDDVVSIKSRLAKQDSLEKQDTLKKQTGKPIMDSLLTEYLADTTSPAERIQLDSTIRSELKENKLTPLFDTLVAKREDYVDFERARMGRQFSLNARLLEVIARFDMVKAESSKQASDRVNARKQVYALSDSIKLVADYKNSNLPTITFRMAVSKLYSGQNCLPLFIKLRYVFDLVTMQPSKLVGFFLTALALTLGAPFWFDLLNKFMQLRGSVKQESGKN